jgi:hypothetical protein
MFSESHLRWRHHASLSAASFEAERGGGGEECVYYNLGTGRVRFYVVLRSSAISQLPGSVSAIPQR